MTFSNYAGVAIIPTLARIVLCVVFITAGYNKMETVDFTHAEAAQLQLLGVNVVMPTTLPSLAPSTAPATAPAPAPAAGTVRALGLYRVALMLDNAHWPQPVTQAWLAALAELCGGGMLVIGLFSRVWALGLSAVMGVAFYFTSLPALLQANWMVNTLGMMEMNTLAVQLSLFVLAFGILLTGAGPLSLDRILFGNPPEPVEPEPERPKTRVM